MRFLPRLHACVAATLVVVLYIHWRRPSLRIQDSIQSVWKGTAHRVVVFGDDWSDIGHYRAVPPPASTVRERDPFRGLLWTEALCERLSCDFIDNFARSLPSNVDLRTAGSVVDSDIFANATKQRGEETLVLFDFKTQVQQFIAFEKQRAQIPGSLRKIDEWTVFTVFFGIWDLMEYSALDKADALHAIDRSVAELVANLDALADHVGEPIKVVIPRLVDVTFLPRFVNRRNDSATTFAPKHHEAVFLWAYWNTVLSQAASDWARGDIFMPDMHGIVMNQVRAKQLYSQHISDATGFGKQTPLFDDVEKPCLAQNADQNANDLQAADVKRCSEPSRHLFWDDLHLSGPAHQLIGEDAARLVRDNNTINSDARHRARLLGSSADPHNERKHSLAFLLKFPPGY